MDKIETQKSRIVKLNDERDNLFRKLEELPEIWANETVGSVKPMDHR